MPKEYIGFEPQERGSINVSWGRDHGHVAVSVAGPIGWRDDLIDRLEHRQDIDPDNDLDWHFQATNRNEINNLIRILRKARDQAFGADA